SQDVLGAAVLGTSDHRLIGFTGGTAAGPVGGVGAVELVELEEHLLGHPGSVRGVLRGALWLVGELAVTVDVGCLSCCLLDLFIGELLLRGRGRILGRFSAVLAGFVLGVALGLVRLGAGRVALGVLRRFVGGARHGAARGIGSGRLGGRLILLLIRLLLALLLTGVSAALPLLLLFLLLLFQGLRVD